MGIENNLEPDAAAATNICWQQANPFPHHLICRQIVQNVAVEWCSVSKPLASFRTEENTNTNIKQNTNQIQKGIQITSACKYTNRYMLCLKPLASIGIESLLQAEFADLAQARNCQIITRYV